MLPGSAVESAEYFYSFKNRQLTLAVLEIIHAFVFRKKYFVFRKNKDFYLSEQFQMIFLYIF